jgi:hypothetical protein
MPPQLLPSDPAGTQEFNDWLSSADSTPRQIVRSAFENIPDMPIHYVVFWELSTTFKQLHDNEFLGFMAGLMYIATHQGHLDMVKILVESGADVHTGFGDALSLLKAAVGQGKAEVLRFLIENDVKINQYNQKGETPLMRAVNRGNREIVEILLDSGADINLIGGNYGTALGVAAFGGEEDIVQILLDRGADVNLVGGDYCTALGAATYPRTQNYFGDELTSEERLAVSRKKQDIIRNLLERGAAVNVAGGKYGTALNIAAHSGDKDLM